MEIQSPSKDTPILYEMSNKDTSILKGNVDHEEADSNPKLAYDAIA